MAALRALGPLALGLAALAAGQPLSGGELAADDECGAAAGEQQCALDALQRKGRAVQAVQESAAWYPTCAALGCFAKYSKHQACQCNSRCSRYGNCCADYGAKCSAVAPQPAHAHNAGGHSARCSAYRHCAGLGHGDCCPTHTGMYLGCCPDSVVPHATAAPPVVVNGRNMMTLYHQTSPKICRMIMAQGFKLGRHGWCGGAIYFALSPEATRTKAITPHSGIGCMIEAKVDVGSVKKYPCCRYCGGHQDQHIHWTEHSLKAKGHDSIEINPGDGPEIVIYNNDRIQSMRIVPFNPAWTPNRMHYRE